MIAARLAAAVAALVLTSAVAAQARPPVLITTSGQSVGMAVDAQGTAHIAYSDPNSGGVGEPLMYCAWPRTARTCTPRPILVDNASPLGQPPLIQAGRPTGAELPEPRLRRVLSERSLAGSPADTATADLNHGHSVNAVTGFSGNVPVLVSGGTTIRTAVSSWSGQGDIHDPATWLGPFNVAPTSYFDLAGGRSGLWLAYQQSTRSGDDRIYARRFNPRTHRFGPCHAIPFGRLGLPPVIELGIGQAADGRMVIAWFNAVRDRIEVSASKTGAHWTRARVLATGVTLPGSIRVGLGPDARGLIVWDDNGDKKIKAVKVDAPALLKGG